MYNEVSNTVYCVPRSYEISLKEPPNTDQELSLIICSVFCCYLTLKKFVLLNLWNLKFFPYFFFFFCDKICLVQVLLHKTKRKRFVKTLIK